MSYDVELESLQVRIADRCARILNTKCKKLIAIVIFCFLAVNTCTAIFSLISGIVSKSIDVASVDVDLHRDLHARLFTAYDAQAYNWWQANNEEHAIAKKGSITGAVSETLVNARKSLIHYNTLLVAVSPRYNDSQRSKNMDCADITALPLPSFTPLQQHYERMKIYAEVFLSKNYHQFESVCGPMFGFARNYIAVYAGHKAVPSEEKANDTTTATKNSTLDLDGKTIEVEEKQEWSTSADAHVQTLETYEKTNAIIISMFNVIDKHAEAYDALDVDKFVKDEIGLKKVGENQDYRYNASRGTFWLLRRSKLRIVFDDKFCDSNVMNVDGLLAIQMQSCLDLIRGIDVRDRARMQHQKGVIFNDEYFKRENEEKAAKQKPKNVKTEL